MIKVEAGAYGIKAILEGPLTRRAVSKIKAAGAQELALNEARGWVTSDLEYLRELSELMSFSILDWTITDIAPIHYLHNLKSLDVATMCRSQIHFSKFPTLESFSVDYSRQKLIGLFECLTLKDLFMNCYKGRQSEPFGRLVNLEKLRLLSPSLGEIEGFRHLKKVKELQLALLRRLNSLKGLEGMENLENLELQSIPHVTKLDEVGHLKNLKRIYLSGRGEIESIRCLEGAPNLARFVMDDKVIVDGDFSVFTRLKNLTFVGYVDKKHYKPSKRELKAILDASSPGSVQVS